LPVEAFVMLPTGVHYRRDAVESGLRAVGCTLAARPRPQSGNVLVTWNRYPAHNGIAKGYENAGGRIVVMENGYLGRDGSGHQLYAMARTHHLGAGDWHVGAPGRWRGQRIALSPWREDPGPQGHILVLPQRGLGEPGVAMPSSWSKETIGRLKSIARRPIRLRPHPGKERPPLDPDLKGCFAVVTWASGAALKAIVAGVPAFYGLPKWIGAPAAVHGVEDLEHPFLGDREPMLDRLSWAQWALDEIAAGEPFKWLLQ
jgi:hypothetical protein